ncbi:MAG TPA: ethylbenzene dehydrogenase-related protein [Nitrospiria bacterium]|jgi:DMSO reductase family type II enzyme heme b subunit
MEKLKINFILFIPLMVFGFSFHTGLALAQEGGVVVYSKLIDGPVPGDDPMSPLWDEKGQVVEFPMSAQVHWEPRLYSEPTAKTVKVRSLHNGEELAILLEYQDPVQGPKDAAAIEFPVGEEKSHFAHAQPMIQVEGGFVNIWYWKEDKFMDMQAKGFGTLKAHSQQDVTGHGVWKDGVWRVVFSRKLETGDEKDVLIKPGEFKQIAFAIWDGENREEGSKKAISSWWYFRAEPLPDQGIYFYAGLAVAGAFLFEWFLIRRIRKRSSNA